MMTLVNKDELLCELYKNYEKDREIIEYIKGFSEAYDVGYVVDNLEKRLDYVSNGDEEEYKNGIADALEIVKKGWCR